MANRRSYTDDQLRAAVAGAECWADVAAALGKRRDYSVAWIRNVADRLGVDYSHLHHRRDPHPVTAAGSPFAGAGNASLCSGLSVATHWFLAKGYNVSLPIEPGPYDLVAESDVGLQRVQVKTTRHTGRNGRYVVRLIRRVYDPDANMNATGRYRRVAYKPTEVDQFFILVSNGDRYLIPVWAVDGRTLLVLDVKYAEFKV